MKTAPNAKLYLAWLLPLIAIGVNVIHRLLRKFRPDHIAWDIALAGIYGALVLAGIVYTVKALKNAKSSKRARAHGIASLVIIGFLAIGVVVSILKYQEMKKQRIPHSLRNLYWAIMRAKDKDGRLPDSTDALNLKKPLPKEFVYLGKGLTLPIKREDQYRYEIVIMYWYDGENFTCVFADGGSRMLTKTSDVKALFKEKSWITGHEYAQKQIKEREARALEQEALAQKQKAYLQKVQVNAEGLGVFSKQYLSYVSFREKLKVKYPDRSSWESGYLHHGEIKIKLNKDFAENLREFYLKHQTEIVCLSMGGTSLRDISPLKDLPLVQLNLGYCKVSDLSPLKGMPLVSLDLWGCKNLEDLTPLEGMPLEVLNISRSGINDISPLQGLKLRELDMDATGVTDIQPLRGMPLKTLDMSATQVGSIASLKGMPLRELKIAVTKEADLSHLQDSPLEKLYLSYPFTGKVPDYIIDLSPLANIKLQELSIPDEVKNIDTLKNIKTLKKINSWPPKRFWKIWAERQKKKR